MEKMPGASSPAYLMLFLHFSDAKLEILRHCSLCLRLKLHGRMPLLHSSNAKLEILPL